MRLISFIGAAMVLGLHLSPLSAAQQDNSYRVTGLKIEGGRVILAQNPGCFTCKRRWRQCRNSCFVPNQTRLSFRQCMIVCDTAGQACVQRFCP